jgi:hypothetical protein
VSGRNSVGVGSGVAVPVGVDGRVAVKVGSRVMAGWVTCVEAQPATNAKSRKE